MGRQKKRKKMIRLEFDLPEEIFHHIQSFMDVKQATRTCLLSKSWYQAWSTGPILAFDVNFKREKDDTAILESIRTSMKRYQESNIKLQKLYYCVRSNVHAWRINNYDSHIDELVREHASELGINELHLACIDTYNDKVLHVPARVFAIPSLTKLSIRGCRIKKLPRIDTTSRLVSLHLDRVHGGGHSILQDILLQCPSIENLDLKNIYSNPSINLGGLHNLVSVRVHSVCQVAFESTSNDVPEFHKLRIVNLKSVKIVGGFFTNFSSRFPCIEDFSLNLNWCTGNELYDHGVQISSRSLKYLNLVLGSLKVDKVELDVPNIWKFGFKSDNIPALSFSTVSKEWESQVEFGPFDYRTRTVEASLLVRLRDFRKELSKSRINLHLHIDSGMDISDLPSSPTLLVENLIVNNYYPQRQDLLSALCRYCRPSYITLISPSCMPLSETIDFAQHAQSLFANQKNATEGSSMMQSLIKYDIKRFEHRSDLLAEWQAIEMRNFVNDLNLGLKRDLIKRGWFQVVLGAC